MIYWLCAPAAIPMNYDDEPQRTCEAHGPGERTPSREEITALRLKQNGCAFAACIGYKQLNFTSVFHIRNAKRFRDLKKGKCVFRDVYNDISADFMPASAFVFLLLDRNGFRRDICPVSCKLTTKIIVPLNRFCARCGNATRRGASERVWPRLG